MLACNLLIDQSDLSINRGFPSPGLSVGLLVVPYLSAVPATDLGRKYLIDTCPVHLKPVVTVSEWAKLDNWTMGILVQRS